MQSQHGPGPVQNGTLGLWGLQQKTTDPQKGKNTPKKIGPYGYISFSDPQNGLSFWFPFQRQPKGGALKKATDPVPHFEGAPKAVPTLSTFAVSRFLNLSANFPHNSKSSIKGSLGGIKVRRWLVCFHLPHHIGGVFDHGKIIWAARVLIPR